MQSISLMLVVGWNLMFVSVFSWLTKLWKVWWSPGRGLKIDEIRRVLPRCSEEELFTLDSRDEPRL